MVVWALLVVVMAAFLIHFDSSFLELVEEAFLVVGFLNSLVVELLVAVVVVVAAVSMV